MRDATRTGSVGRRVTAVLAWSVMLAAVAVLAAAVVVPRVTGATPYTVLTGSMEPMLPPGTLVVVRPVQPEDVRIGDVVTVQLRSGESEVVTHRVSGVSLTLDGRLSFETKGDANGAPDATLRRPEQVRGVLWYSVPHLGRAGAWLSSTDRDLLTIVVAAGLGLYAASMFAAAGLGRRTGVRRA